jgi:hypothetical protein
MSFKIRLSLQRLDGIITDRRDMTMQRKQNKLPLINDLSVTHLRIIVIYSPDYLVSCNYTI